MIQQGSLGLFFLEMSWFFTSYLDEQYAKVNLPVNFEYFSKK